MLKDFVHRFQLISGSVWTKHYKVLDTVFNLINFDCRHDFSIVLLKKIEKLIIKNIKRFLSRLIFTYLNSRFFSVISAVSRGAQWSGRQCCTLALSARCQNTCATAASRNDLSNGCRQSDEQTFFSCVERQEIGDDCCGNARTSECLQNCKDIFKNKLTPSKKQRNSALEACEQSDPRIIQCIKNHTDLTVNSNLKKCKLNLFYW